jgi:hypothetical protein
MAKKKEAKAVKEVKTSGVKTSGVKTSGVKTSGVKTSGVNLDGLTLEQLQLLQGEIFQKTEKVMDADKENRLADAKASGKLQEMRAAAKEFHKEVKAMARGGQFTLTLPITFSFKGQVNEDLNPFGTNGVNLHDIMDFEFNGKLDASGLNKKQKAILSTVVEEYARDACEDIWDIVPEDILKRLDDFEERFNTFLVEADELGLEAKDLQ